MSDEQQLRDGLDEAVPAPPPMPDRGAAARARARRARLRRMSVAGGLVAVVVVASVAVWTARRHDPGPTVTGSAATACRLLAKELKPDHYLDGRVVAGQIAAGWLSNIRTDVDPATYRDDDRVTVCLMSRQFGYALYVVGQSGSHELVTASAYVGVGGIQWTMTRLDQRITGGESLTAAPFSCSGPHTERYPDVRTSLPEGATAARICFDGEFFTPTQVLTQHLDTLVREVNSAPIVYSAPNIACGGAEGDYSYRVVFRYPAGTRSVSEETCRGLAVGQYTRSLRVRLDQVFSSLLIRQVGATPGSVTAPRCPSSSTDQPAGVGDLHNVVAARYCPAGVRGAGRVLTPSELGQLRRWGRSFLGATTEPENLCPRPAAGWPRLTITDAWGNDYTVALVGCGRRIFPAAVDWAAPAKVIYPIGESNGMAQLARELAHEAP